MDVANPSCARVLFADLAPEQMQALPKRRRLWGYWVYVAALRLKDGQLLVVVISDSPESAISDYARRWEIETLFGCLIPIRDPKRNIDRVLGDRVAASIWLESVE